MQLLCPISYFVGRLDSYPKKLKGLYGRILNTSYCQKIKKYSHFYFHLVAYWPKLFVADDMLDKADYFKNGKVDKNALVSFIRDLKKNTKLSDTDAAVLAASKVGIQNWLNNILSVLIMSLRTLIVGLIWYKHEVSVTCVIHSSRSTCFMNWVDFSRLHYLGRFFYKVNLGT